VTAGENGAIEQEKRVAAERAAAMVVDGMALGLGTGSTVAYLLPALAERRLNITCVATSPATEAAARSVGLEVVPFVGVARLDLTIDGADQVDPRGWLVKGGGGAHTRERIVAAAADRFIVIVSSDKPVVRLAPPVPLELMAFGLDATLASLPAARVRPGAPTPDGGILADYFGPLEDPGTLSAQLDALPGLVAHGLFPPDLVSLVLVGRGDGLEEIQPSA
jgi:ribose 5-phosphate isomerase A